MQLVRVTLLLSSIGLVVGCSPTTLPSPSPQEVKQAQLQWPGVVAADLERGRDLYRAHCANCHQLVPPSRFSPSDWPTQIAEMQERAGLDQNEVTLVTRYVVTIAGRTRPAR